MKKVLLTTSALAGLSAVAATSAGAAEAPVLTFSGNLSYEYIFVDNEVRFGRFFPVAVAATAAAFVLFCHKASFPTGAWRRLVRSQWAWCPPIIETGTPAFTWCKVG